MSDPLFTPNETYRMSAPPVLPRLLAQDLPVHNMQKLYNTYQNTYVAFLHREEYASITPPDYLMPLIHASLGSRAGIHLTLLWGRLSTALWAWQTNFR
jgi:hypothetical protein